MDDDCLAGLWSAADYDKKQRIQKALFPSGLTLSRNGFRTALTPPFFKEFEEIEVKKMSVPRHG